MKERDAGVSLLDYLFKRFSYKPKSEWNSRIQSGRILLDGELASAETIVSAGDHIAHHNPKVGEPAVPDNLKVIRETEDWLAIFKPAPMPVHPGGRFNKNSCISILEDERGERLWVTHRLDSVTSGIVLFAKNKSTARELTHAFAESKFQKRYLAVAKGVPKENEWTVEKAIKRKSGFVFHVSDEADSKRAITNFSLLDVQELEEGKRSLISCFPKTGRTHQIRLHLLHSGIPIIDDEIYLHQQPDKSLIQRRSISLLHHKLVLPDLDIDLTSPLPDHWAWNSIPAEYSV